MGVSLTALLLPKLAVGSILQLRVGASVLRPAPKLLYPPVDLSYFDAPIGWRA
jgi:hypothetical protein